MYHRLARTAVLAISVLLVAGCSGTGAAWTGGRVAMNLMKKDSHLRIWLDGQKGEQSMLKKAATGYSRWKIKEPVSTSPKLQFEIRDPDRFGRITNVSIQIHQEFEADYSHLAEFKVFAATKDTQAQMKPGVEYDLGAPGEGFKVLNVTDDEVSGVELKPGLKHMLVLTVAADKSESAQIYFETK
jgi:hypothetical protein